MPFVQGSNTYSLKGKQNLLRLIEVISTSLIWKQKEPAILNEQVKYRVRSFQTQDKPSISSTRLIGSAGVVKQATVEYTDYLDGIASNSLHLMFADTKRYQLSIRSGNSVKHDPLNLDTIRTIGTRVVVEWREDNELLDQKPGWQQSACTTVRQTW